MEEASWKKPALERGKKKEKNWYVLWLWGEEKQPQVADLFCNVVSTMVLTRATSGEANSSCLFEIFLLNKLQTDQSSNFIY